MPTIENENPETEEDDVEQDKDETLEDENTGSDGDDDSEGSIDEDGSGKHPFFLSLYTARPSFEYYRCTMYTPGCRMKAYK